MPRCTTIFLSTFFGATALLAADQVDFESQIKPIFSQHCLECHGSQEQRSGFRLDRRAAALRGGDLGQPAIVPGHPEQSLLLTAVRGSDPDLRMPPEGDLLAGEQVELLRLWIVEGASWPGQMFEEAQAQTSDHWSLQPLIRPRVPAVGSTWSSNPIDSFVLRKLQANGLRHSSEADRSTLIRRISLDLTGLPPTPDQVDSFANDPAATSAAYDRVVNRLLRSPRYGERWAQHWLDVIRWAETVGFETNFERPNAWPYRDWIIESLNADKPYDRFVFEQIAGDTVGEDAALGFLVAGPANLPGQIGRDEEAMRQARQDELDEVIRTVSQSLFGLTIGCARCHNHKFDPILQRDYYAMQAVFAGLTYGDRRLRGAENDAWSERVPPLRAKLERLRAEREQMRRAFGLRPPIKSIHADTFEPVLCKAVRMRIAATENGGSASLYEFEIWTVDSAEAPSKNVGLAANGGTPSASSFALENQTRHFDNLVDGTVDKRQAFPWVSARGGPAWIQVDLAEPTTIDRIVWHQGRTVPVDYEIDLQVADGTWQTVAHTRDRLPRVDDERESAQVQLAGLSTAQIEQLLQFTAGLRQTEEERVRLSNGPQVYAASFVAEPGPTWLLRRGDPMQRGLQVDPAAPAVLNDESFPSRLDVDRRVALAHHLTQTGHPLTARVIVNRIWQHHFGAGLVGTPSDFGKMGEVPSHPELLDWLTVDFVENGWSIKRLHRQIVTSMTYRQANRPRQAAMRVDRNSQWLWRFPPRRLEAESIRDSILSVSGKLNLKMGGPGFDFFNQRGGLSDYTSKEVFEPTGWRRMIYAHKVRMQAVDIFGAFDCPDAGQMRPERTRSITPLQSLSFLNSPFVSRQAKFFASRVQHDVGDAIGHQVEHAFRLALSRGPTSTEKQQMVELATDHGLEQVCRVLYNTSEFVFLP
jgi:mono/diheme cytochrome c family protein